MKIMRNNLFLILAPEAPVVAATRGCSRANLIVYDFNVIVFINFEAPFMNSFKTSLAATSLSKTSILLHTVCPEVPVNSSWRHLHLDKQSVTTIWVASAETSRDKATEPSVEAP